jgi:hypothetical protein
MATVTHTRLIDDLDQTSDADESVDFGIDGRKCTIDLTTEHANELRAVLQPYLDAARKAGGGGGHGGKPSKPGKPESGGRARVDREEALAIRTWVREHGGHIGDRGRISPKYVDAYRSGDESIFDKGGDEEDDQHADQQPETDETDDLLEDDDLEDGEGDAQPVGSGSGGIGDPFATFTDPGGPHF